jgi:signal transduction histidine kinase/FixJ family two-component response regulator/HPt (histidine-containing phosphotransfer) domain-containing protein
VVALPGYGRIEPGAASFHESTMREDRSSGQTQTWWGKLDDDFCQAMVEGLNCHRQAYVVSADCDGRIIACNDAMARLFGLRQDEFRDESIWDKLVESDHARLNGRLNQAHFSADPFLLNFVTPNHSPITLDCSLAPMSRGRFVVIGVPVQSSGEGSEVAWLKLNNSFATLSRENARKSKQLKLQNSEMVRTTEELKRANEALTEARTAALQAAEAKADFLRHMSHEIRTPMNGVMGMIQLLLATTLSPEQRRYATISHTSGRTLLALIDDILDLSKMEAHKIALENLTFSVRRTIDDVVQLLSVLAGAKGLHIHSRVSEDIPQLLRGDAHRLRQVLTNLAGNAIKFTERGVVTLDAALECEAAGTVTVRFAVTDTGIGIRPDQAQALFSPFVQADTSTTRKYGGTGLGLAISKQLVDLMGGKIGIDSREGEGSTFWFTAVFETAPESILVSNLEPASAVEQTSASEAVTGGFVPGFVPPRVKAKGHAARILLADDDPTNQAVALAQLELLGYNADAVANGAEALEALQYGTYDLVLMDSEMPTMDGYEATRRIRESSRPNIPIIGVTAHAMQNERDRCIREGMNGFLSKPVDLQLLAEVLERWIPRIDSRVEVQTVEGAGLEENAAIFDSEAFLKRLMGDRRLAGKIIRGFLDGVPPLLNNLQKRFDESDETGARLLAHTLKGSAATVSAVGLREIGQEMEQSAAAGQLDRFGELLPRAVEEFERLKSTLEKAGWL